MNLYYGERQGGHKGIGGQAQSNRAIKEQMSTFEHFELVLEDLRRELCKNKLLKT
jgi:hypothetical protein